MKYDILNLGTAPNPYAVIEYGPEKIIYERESWRVRISNLTWEDANLFVEALTTQEEQNP